MNPIGCDSAQLSNLLFFCGFDNITLENENKLYFFEQKKIKQKQIIIKKEKINKIVKKKKAVKKIHKTITDPNSPFAVLQKLL